MRASRVEHGSGYPWPNYQHNAVDRAIQLIKAQDESVSLGGTPISGKPLTEVCLKGIC